MKSRGKIEEELSKMNQDIILLRETSNVQVLMLFLFLNFGLQLHLTTI